jgi:hypothetical protein
VKRLKHQLTRSERVILQGWALTPTQAEIREMQETAEHECYLILKKAREQADKIRRTAEKETVARVEALKRVERVHGLARIELRTMLGAMLEALNSPSDVVRESLKDPQLMEDLQSITRAAVGANTAAALDVAAESEGGHDNAVQDHLPALNPPPRAELSAPSQIAGSREGGVGDLREGRSEPADGTTDQLEDVADWPGVDTYAPST